MMMRYYYYFLTLKENEKRHVSSIVVIGRSGCKYNKIQSVSLMIGWPV